MKDNGQYYRESTDEKKWGEETHDGQEVTG